MLRIPLRPLDAWAILFALAAAATGRLAYAWGTDGHQIVALIAERNLTPVAVLKVERLLALEPGATLASISMWADEHRSPATAPWHYVNMPKGECIFQATPDCPNGACVVGAIQAQLARLKSSAPDADRLVALKYVVHFVADVHQPLHAGWAEDRGGNSYQLQAFGRGTNLHALWDASLLKSIEPDAKKFAVAIANNPPATSTDFAPGRWAEESCRIVNDPEFYPPRKLPDEYVGRYGPTLADQLGRAGLRLAAILNGL